MNTIRELKQQEKYKSMLKRKNKEKNIYKDKNSSLRIEKMNLIKCVERKDKELERLKQLYETDKESWKEQMYELQERIDKAIEYIEEKEEILLNCNEEWLDHDEMIDKKRFEKILEILKGEDKE